MNYQDYQNKASSEKIVLATIDAAKRLIGWTLDSGSIYYISYEFDKIVSIEDSNTPYTEVSDLGSVTTSTYFHDRSAKRIYLEASDSSNPNSRYLVGIVRLFLSNLPVTLPNDFDAGYEVYFEPVIEPSSLFGVEIDTINNNGEAIEGSGSLNILNDFDFWKSNFDKLTFENQRCFMYSFNRDLPLTEMKKIFKGTIQDKKYAGNKITFTLKDQLSEIRTDIILPNIEDIAGARVPENLLKAKQRMILGRVFGIRPINIDQVLDGYPLTGTLSITVGEVDLVGTGTQFLKELSPNDEIVLNGQKVTIETVIDDTNATISEEYESSSSVVNSSALVVPQEPKRYTNRIFNVCGHVVREPETTIIGGSTIEELNVGSTLNIYPNDRLYIGTLGSGELVTVDSVVGSSYIRLKNSLATDPVIGTTILRPAVQNVRIADRLLEYYRDYTFDAETGILELHEDAEVNVSSVYSLGYTMTFTNTSRVVTGTGFELNIKPGYMVTVLGQTDYFEVLSVDSDTQLTLRTASTFTSTQEGRYKPFVYNEDETVLTLDCLGRTDDDTVEGNLILTAPGLTELLLKDIGLTDDIDTDTFELSKTLASQNIGIMVPEKYDSTETRIYRDVINDINKSVFGSLIQTSEFKLGYTILNPRKPTTSMKFMESDILNFTFDSTNKNSVKTVTLQYLFKEYDYLTNSELQQSIDHTSDKSTYVLKTDRVRVIKTYLVEETDARIASARWSFLLSNSAGRLIITTKLQGALLNIGDILEIDHQKLFTRFGDITNNKLMMVEAVKRNGLTVQIECTDLNNLFNRVACINDAEENYTDSSSEERLYGGYYTDDYGLIDNDEISHETNLIW